jgi:hypothetical protein
MGQIALELLGCKWRVMRGRYFGEEVRDLTDFGGAVGGAAQREGDGYGGHEDFRA